MTAQIELSEAVNNNYHFFSTKHLSSLEFVIVQFLVDIVFYIVILIFLSTMHLSLINPRLSSLTNLFEYIHSHQISINFIFLKKSLPVLSCSHWTGCPGPAVQLPSWVFLSRSAGSEPLFFSTRSSSFLIYSLILMDYIPQLSEGLREMNFFQTLSLRKYLYFILKLDQQYRQVQISFFFRILKALLLPCFPASTIVKES